MFDKLEDLLVRFEEVLNELGEPGVTDNQERFQKLMKEQSELQPIVDTYKEYKAVSYTHLFDKRVGPAVAKAVAEAARRTGVARI